MCIPSPGTSPFMVIAVVLSTLFEGLKMDASIVTGTALVLLGNLFVLGVKLPRQIQYTRRHSAASG